jgi:hypothetical protein
MAPQEITLYNGIEISKRDQAFLDRSNARIANMDKSAINNKTVKDELSLNYVRYTSSSSMK